MGRHGSLGLGGLLVLPAVPPIVTPARDLCPEPLMFADDGQIPNSLLPALVYRDIEETADVAACEALFAANGWTGAWRNGIFGFHHFHSTTHEVLGIVAGNVTVALGGPEGRRLEARRGDVLVLPAGTGHGNDGASHDLLVVGAYPNGMAWDVRRGDPSERDEVLANIRGVPLPDCDPVLGADGPLADLWRPNG